VAPTEQNEGASRLSAQVEAMAGWSVPEADIAVVIGIAP
jgi:hypothetical protein